MPSSPSRRILALAISNEEEDNRHLSGLRGGLLREQYAASAKVFDQMAEEEVQHRTMLFDLYRSRFGDYLPLIRRQDVKVIRPPQARCGWCGRSASTRCATYAEAMEYETARFYRKAAHRRGDASVRELLDKLAEAEAEHESLAHQLGQTILTKPARAKRGRDRHGACGNSCCNSCSRGSPG